MAGSLTDRSQLLNPDYSRLGRARRPNSKYGINTQGGRSVPMRQSVDFGSSGRGSVGGVQEGPYTRELYNYGVGATVGGPDYESTTMRATSPNGKRSRSVQVETMSPGQYDRKVGSFELSRRGGGTYGANPYETARINQMGGNITPDPEFGRGLGGESLAQRNARTLRNARQSGFSY